jgi:hypothetical protein
MLLGTVEKESHAVVVRDCQGVGGGSGRESRAGEDVTGSGGGGQQGLQGCNDVGRGVSRSGGGGDLVVLVISGTVKNVARAKGVLASKFPCLGEAGVTLLGGDVTSRPPPSSAGLTRLSQTSPSRPGGVNGAVERVGESDMLSCSSPEACVLTQGTPEKFEGGEECVCMTVPAKLVGPRICGPKRCVLRYRDSVWRSWGIDDVWV